MVVTKDNDKICRLVDDCPLLEDCKGNGKGDSSSCPMKHWSFDELLCGPPRCPECDSLNQFEASHAESLTSRDYRDLNRYWMEHLNRHIEISESRKIRRTESEQP